MNEVYLLEVKDKVIGWGTYKVFKDLTEAKHFEEKLKEENLFEDTSVLPYDLD